MKKKHFESEVKKIIAISREFGIKKVVLFGSCVDNIEHARDIDVAIIGIRPGDFFRYYGKVSMAIRDEVDIVDFNDIRKHLQNRIVSKGKVIYESGN